MSRYFQNVNNLGELRKQYRDLLKKYHPDNPNGSTEACKEINVEYDKLFKLLKDRHESTAGTDTKTEFDFKQDSAIRDTLQKIIIFDGINIEIVGSWIWCDGTTYPYKDSLKEYGFQWSKVRKKWHRSATDGFYTKRKKRLDFEEIRSRYGSTEVKTERRYALA